MSLPLPTAAPAVLIPCTVLQSRQASATHAELAVGNDVVRASLLLDADQLAGVLDQLGALRDALDPAPAATPALHLPGAGLVLP